MSERISNLEAWPSHSDEEFRELCALSTTETLTTEERQRLEEHLKACASCRELKQHYNNLVSNEISKLAPHLTLKSDSEPPSPSWSLKEGERELLERLDREIPATKTPTPKNRRQRPAKPFWFAIAALVLLAVGIFIFRFVDHAGSEGERTESSVARISLPPPMTAKIDVPSAESKKHDREMVSLETALRLCQREIEQLKAEKSQLQDDLRQQTTQAKQRSQDRTQLDQELTASEVKSLDLKNKLNALSSWDADEVVQLNALQIEVDGLRRTIDQKNHEIAQNEELLTHDRDIRDLMAERNLYIVDVYDTKKSGELQKPFGRIFYTKNKRLIFYGYDLDQQPGLKNASSFQAWGALDKDSKSINLGLFYRDESNQNRWILRYNDTKTISQLDRVFVTVEPEGGSSKPTGKPLLFSSLRIEPNHP